MNKKTHLISLVILLGFISFHAISQSSRGTKVQPAKTQPKTKQKSSTESEVKDSLKSVKNIDQGTEDEGPLRVEVEAKKTSDNYNVIPVGQNGVVMLYPSDEKSTKGKGSTDWVWTKLDSRFVEQKTIINSVSNDLRYATYFVDEASGHLYVLFGKPDDNPGLPATNGYLNNFVVYDMNLADNSIESVSGTFTKKMHLNAMYTVGKDVYIGGSVVPTNKQIKGQVCLALATCFIGGKRHFDVFPNLVKVSMDSKKVTEIKVPVTKQGEVLSFDYDTVSSKLNVVVVEAPMPFDRKLCIFHVDGNSLKNRLDIKTQAGYYLLNGKLQNLDQNEKIIIGSYAKTTGNDKVQFGIQRKVRNTMIASTGFFISKYSGNTQSYIRFYPFSKFSAINSEIEKKSKGSEKKKEKLESKASYNVLVHDIIQRGDQLIIIADVYLAHYHVEQRTSMDSKGNMTTSNVTVFDGWQFTNALVAAFDQSGEMKWNDSFDLPGNIYSNIKPQVKVLVNQRNDNVVLVYNSGGVISSKIIKGDKLSEGSSDVKIETGSSKDKLRESTFSSIEYWYHNYFIAYGFEKIKSSDKKADKKKRQVFYLNKVAYR